MVALWGFGGLGEGEMRGVKGRISLTWETGCNFLCVHVLDADQVDDFEQQLNWFRVLSVGFLLLFFIVLWMARGGRSSSNVM